MSEMEQSVRVLRSLAGMRERFLVLARRLEREADVQGVTSDLDVRSYQGETRVEAFVEATLTTGNSVVWWLDIHEHEGDWLFEPVVFVQHGEGKDDVARPPAGRVTDDRQFAAAVDEAMQALLSAPDQNLRVARDWNGTSPSFRFAPG